MSTYIGSDRIISVSKSPYDGDVFDFMAGGLFDDTYAGGVNYHPLMLPSPNMKSLFMERSVGKTLQLLQLQEDFVEYALMPLQMYDYLSEKEVRVIVGYTTQSIDTLLSLKYGVSIFNDGAQINFDGLSSGGFSLESLSKEMSQDTMMEDTFGIIGERIAGPLGRAIAESLYDGIATGNWSADNFGMNLAESVTKEIIGQTVNRATAGLVGAMGVTNPATATVVGMIVGSLVMEAFEVAVGLDSQYGYGGSYIGTDVYGRAQYAEIQGSFSARSAQQVKDLIGEFSSLFGGEYTSANERAMHDTLSSMMESAMSLAEDSFDKNIGIATAKALDAYQAAQEALNALEKGMDGYSESFDGSASDGGPDSDGFSGGGDANAGGGYGMDSDGNPGI